MVIIRIPVEAKTGEGLDAWIERLEGEVAATGELFP